MTRKVDLLGFGRIYLNQTRHAKLCIVVVNRTASHGISWFPARFKRAAKDREGIVMTLSQRRDKFPNHQAQETWWQCQSQFSLLAHSRPVDLGPHN